MVTIRLMAAKSRTPGARPIDVADGPQRDLEAPLQAADQRVRLAAPDGDGADHGGVGAHQGAGRIRRDAAPARDLEIGRDVVAVARIVLGIDEVEILALADREAEALEPRLDHPRAADQDRARDLVLDDGLHRAQHALVLALGIDDALGVLLRLGEDRLHDEAGAEDEAVQRSA